MFTWHPTPVLLPGKSHGQRSLVGCSPWGLWESDMTERLHFHFSLSCIGEGNGSALQCSCLKNPRDGGAWWAAVSGVIQSWTRLKRLSSSSSYQGNAGLIEWVKMCCSLFLIFFWKSLREIGVSSLNIWQNSSVKTLSGPQLLFLGEIFWLLIQNPFRNRIIKIFCFFLI